MLSFRPRLNEFKFEQKKSYDYDYVFEVIFYLYFDKAANMLGFEFKLKEMKFSGQLGLFTYSVFVEEKNVRSKHFKIRCILISICLFVKN